MLRPAGGGVYVVSTGAEEQRALQRAIYGATSDAEVDARWRAALERLPEAALCVLGVPSDVGAGFVRGANLAPAALRRQLLEGHSLLYRDARVVDLGDVLVVPQLLHDDMLSPAQLAQTRQALHGSAAVHWPVSPLSVTERVLRVVRQVAPRCVPLVLGGDHSVSWPVVAALAEGREQRLGILHFDAHTDLLADRLGVRYCFATWAYHANELVGRGARLAQVGLRTSRRTRAEWEAELDVRQYWMAEVHGRPLASIAEEIIAAFRRAGVEGLYVSNDIDGTDPVFASATGTPEPGGLHPDEVVELIERVGAAFPLWGSDLVEVAPPVGGKAAVEPSMTLHTAARYIETQVRLVLG
jgi:agmatinase